MANHSAAYNDALARLSQVMQARADYDQRQSEFDRNLIMQDRDQAARRAYSQERQSDTNWARPAVAGATAGSMFGPWGALIGGVAGAGMGVAGAVQRRQKDKPGLSTWSAIGNTLGDSKPWTTELRDNPMGIVGLAGNLKKGQENDAKMQALQTARRPYGSDVTTGMGLGSSIPAAGYQQGPQYGYGGVGQQGIQAPSGPGDFMTEEELLMAKRQGLLPDLGYG